MFKFKSMERIYIYSQVNEENAQLKAICTQITKYILKIIRPFLKDYFVQFGITSVYLHFRYADDNKFHLVGSVTYSKDEIDNII